MNDTRLICGWPTSRIAAAIAAVWLSAGLLPDTAAAAGGVPHSHAAVFLGGGVETKRDGRQREVGIALGGEYEYRFHEQWGVGGIFEALGKKTLRDVVVVVPVSFHPSPRWRVFAGPGYEFTERKDKPLLRVGVGYEFHFKGGWTLAPEVIGDFIDGGARTWLAGLALGYEF